MAVQILCGLCGVSVAKVGGLMHRMGTSEETKVAIKLRGDGDKVCRTCWGFLCLQDKEDLVDTISDLLDELDEANKARDGLEELKESAVEEAAEYKKALEDMQDTITRLV